MSIFIPRVKYPRGYSFYGRRTVANCAGTPATTSIRRTIYGTLTGARTENNCCRCRVTFFNNSFATVREGCVVRLLRTTRCCIGGGGMAKVEVSAHPSTVSGRALSLLGGCNMASVRLNTRDVGSTILRTGFHKRSTRYMEGTSRLVGDTNFRLNLRVVAKLCGSAGSHSVRATGRFIGVGPGAIQVCPAIILGGACLNGLCGRGGCRPVSITGSISLYTSLIRCFRSRGVSIVHINLRTDGSVERGVCNNYCRRYFNRVITSGVVFGGVASCPPNGCRIFVGRGSVSGLLNGGGSGLRRLGGTNCRVFVGCSGTLTPGRIEMKWVLLGALRVRNFGSFPSGARLGFKGNVATIMKPGNSKGDGVSSTIH